MSSATPHPPSKLYQRRASFALGLGWALSTLLGGHPAAAAGRPVVALPLTFEGELAERSREILQQRFAQGLSARAIQLQGEKTATPTSPPQLGGTCDADCRRKIAQQTHARYLAGGRIVDRYDDYELELWLYDGDSGSALATIRRPCSLCGLRELSDTIDLAATALLAKLQTLIEGPTGVARAQGGLDIQLARESEHPTGWRRASGWTALVAGTAAAAAGIALLAIDGQATGCRQGRVLDEICDGTRKSSVAGWTLAGSGLVALVGGIYLLLDN